MLTLPKAYEPSEHEEAIAAAERASGLYTPEHLPPSLLATRLPDTREIFALVLPPPNATGTLHIGHAVMLAVEDIMVRFARMRGQKALWIPGTDHAAIATQVKVEKMLQKEEGLSRFDLGREAFLKRVDAFVDGSRATINAQVRAMGCSIDWTREAFTLDVQRNRAVRTMFKRMYDDRLIYRGHRLVNWDPVGQTVISDEEIVSVERPSVLYTFQYAADVPIPIATTRPETKVGDTAIAVHPEGQWKEYIGKTFDVTFAGAHLHLTVIGDADVDPAFGTGALGVTPAHSMIDEAMAKRHNVPMVQVIGEDGCMLDAAGPLVKGLPVLDAREKVVSWLREQGLLQQEEDMMQTVATAERTGAVIEPLPKLQWFVNVTKPFAFRQSKRQPMEGLMDGQEVTLQSLLQHCVRTQQMQIIPSSFEATYFHWVDNLRDWCISRQLWYGHRIPAWYRGEEVFVGVDAPQGEGWQQDEDTLDTWFSSGMWTFSTLGWPDEQAPDLQTYHPTNVLETGRDILTFWVVRMVMMSAYALGEVPFRYTYLHGLVRDDQGRKMSKSLDNIINPLDMIAKYGTDAVRLSLVVGLSPGNDSRTSEEKIAGFRNFTNKLWNIGRFVLMSVAEPCVVDAVPEAVTAADAWILQRLGETMATVTAQLDEPQFAFSSAAEALRELTWSDVADEYVEVAKVQMRDEALKQSTEQVLLYVLSTLLKAWHPFMPFVTTRLWNELAPSRPLLIEPWPLVTYDATDARVTLFETGKELAKEIRALRALYRVPPSLRVHVYVETTLPLSPTERATLEQRARCTLLDQKPIEGTVSAVLAGAVAYIVLAGAVDLAAERVRLQGELTDLHRYIAQGEQKLANADFVARAPETVVATAREALAEAIARRDVLQAQLAALM